MNRVRRRLSAVAAPVVVAAAALAALTAAPAQAAPSLEAAGDSWSTGTPAGASAVSQDAGR
ncbi:hypothetical protein [Streptomyces johnsoniae]|uniref:Uncharacterized protein n=1 Tax=Streptomyces johnsoniae TaxID=3075532 RepID=A0ABU2RZD2_9ACTN|nr:hypothetical protein [Streptomyces sp. DSM 41886]MDT0441858.1 hypothetical protein [Streptomyces sp. DSM 41886]